MQKFDYQIVTSDNTWVGGGVEATQEEINTELVLTKERLIDEGFKGDIIVLKAEKMTQQTITIE